MKETHRNRITLGFENNLKIKKDKEGLALKRTHNYINCIKTGPQKLSQLEVLEFSCIISNDQQGVTLCVALMVRAGHFLTSVNK